MKRSNGSSKSTASQPDRISCPLECLSCACLAYGGAAVLAAHYVRQITRRQFTFLLPHETVTEEQESYDEAPIPPTVDAFE